MSGFVVDLVAIALIGLIIWWFWLSKPRIQRVSGSSPIDVIVDNGVYTPTRIEVPIGQPVTLRFIRHDPSPCAEKVIFDGLEKSLDLPLDKPADLTLTPDRPGEFEFTCQMKMYRGTLVVKSS